MEASVPMRRLNVLSDLPKSVSLLTLEPVEVGVPSEPVAPLMGLVSHQTDAVTGLLARRLFRARTEDVRSASTSPPLA